MESILEYPNLLNFDIGLVPLSDNNFNNSKSTIKGLEYMAAGIPFIASPSEPYRELKQINGLGLLAERPRDWKWCLEYLMDKSVRQKMAEEQRTAVKEFSIENNWTKWLTAYLATLS